MEPPKEEIQGGCTKSCEREGPDGGSQKSQRCRDVIRQSSISALDAHAETNVAPSAKKSGTTLVIPLFASNCSYGAISGLGEAAVHPAGFSAWLIR